MSSHELVVGPSQPDTRIVAASPSFLSVIHQVGRIAAARHPVLICGPSQAGHKIIAQRLHRLGPGVGKPFIDLDCAALSANLVETELSAHHPVGFTPGTSSDLGPFESVGSGTLFLDEIDELPLALQSALLRVLETGSFRPFGSSEEQRFQGRIVAATHRTLRELVNQGLFREDLYCRLAVFEIELPGLDKRPEDVVVLARYFASLQSRPLSFTSDANALLMRQRWPGHARQLRTLIERLGAVVDDPLVSAAVLKPFLCEDRSLKRLVPPSDVTDMLMRLPGKNKLAAAEQLLVEHALKLSRGDTCAAAQMLGVHRQVIERRLKLREQYEPDLQSALNLAFMATTNSRFQSAIRVLRPLLDSSESQSYTPAVGRQLVEGWRLLGVCYRGLQGWMSPDARASDRAALRIGTDLCEPTELAALQFGIWSSQLMALDLRQARSTAQEMLRRGYAGGTAQMLDEAHIALANTLYWLGDTQECLSILAQSRLTDRASRRQVGAQGLDFVALALTLEGLSAFHSGFFSRARTALERLKALGDEHHCAFGEAVILQGAAWLSCLFEDAEAVEVYARRLVLVSRDNGFTFYQGVGLIFQGWHMAQGGALEAGLAMIVDGYENHVLRHGGHLFYSFQIWKRAELLLHAGRALESSTLILQAIDRADTYQEKVYLCDLMVVRARSFQALDHPESEDMLRTALSTAYALGSLPARISAATHLAALLADSARHDKALHTLERAMTGVSMQQSPPSLSHAHSVLVALQPARSLIHHN
ncbi:sigma 54-interacting transcriptional regulator [Pseudomonas triticifolii]|uniref:Sigma-54-dependent Fis family transcriptional regulator n=1 Tax=Pseudomonas triticifolii TaxID=2762592 RepID=A0ABR7BAJ4_9PSED|nr:sigma 54-interacting transcriptional regulator [Pseudomonas triticifolii]MBC3954195.1 sigma-54-dependent Fis family transcriptional regulator [Pseudomonas triticifolii]